MAANEHSSRTDAWGDGQDYENYMGRWSRKIAHEFVAWLGQPPLRTWLDVGCGTGALTATILAECEPRSIVAIDPSGPFIEYARKSVPDPRVRFEVGTANSLPVADDSVDVLASALAFNFFPNRPAALAEMLRVAKPSATISIYVWDYPGGGMGFMDAFWEAAIAVEPNAATSGERSRFPFCTPQALVNELEVAGVTNVAVRPIEVTAQFSDFDDLWAPFTRGTGPAPSYYQRLDPEAQKALKWRLESSLRGNLPIQFPARAWALRGHKV